MAVLNVEGALLTLASQTRLIWKVEADLVVVPEVVVEVPPVEVAITAMPSDIDDTNLR